MQAIYKPDINVQNHQYSNHTPKFSLNKRVWPTKLVIISADAGAKIACGPGMGNYYMSLQIMYGLTTWLSFVLEAVVQDNLCSKDYS